MKRLFAAVAAVLMASACSGGAAASNWARIAEISYVLPAQLPKGWVLSSATERPGRPFSSWTNHSEIYINKGLDEVIVLGATKSDKRKATEPSDPSTDAGYPPWAIAYVLPRDDRLVDTVNTSSHWRTVDLELFVLHIAPKRNATLVNRVARQFKVETRFAFDPPTIHNGFHHIASSGDEVTDYTMVFTPKSYAGANRKAATKRTDDGPSIAINVGAHFYVQSSALTDLANATVRETRPGYREIEFVRDGTHVGIGSGSVSKSELMAVAKSLRRMSHESWKATWGDRLFSQDPPD